jgi:hypothetical protein
MIRAFALALAATLLVGGLAHAGSIGIGTFGGMSVPVVQEDQDQGAVYGLRVPVSLVPLLTAEPFFSFSSLGDKSVDLGGISVTREGSDVTTFGLNAMLTMGGPVRFFPYVGIGSAKFKRAGQDESFTSYQMGLGFGFTPAPKFNVDIRGELQAAAKDGVSRKMANVLVGVSYALVSLP